MKRFFCLYFYICCLLVASCVHIPNGKYVVIDLDNHKYLQVEEIHLSDIAESIHLIPLETNDSILISNISDILFEDSKLCLHTFYGVFVFDLDGKFLNMISSIGRGPREYISVSGLFSDNDAVWLLDGQGNKSMKFTYSGKVCEEFFLEKQMFTSFHYLGDDTFIGFIPDNGQPETDIMLAFFNATGIIDSVLYRKPILEGDIIWSLGNEASFINHGIQVKFKHLFNDTIYAIRDNKLTPETVLYLGARKANENARAVAVNSDPNTHNIFDGMDKVLLQGENNRFIYLKVENIDLFYDKEEHKKHKWEFFLPKDERGGDEYAKKFTPLRIDKHGNLLGETVSDNLEDNPVIVIAKLKQ